MNYERPPELLGPQVILEPLGQHHREALRAGAAADETIWRYFPINYNGAGEDFDSWFDQTMARGARGEHFPFAVLARSSGVILGTTRLYDMVPAHRRLAIGSTWYLPAARGTLINLEVRLLTLNYVFDHLGVNRVELIADPENLGSRAAMKILGAVQEGVARRHRIYKDGRVRDSVVYSIISDEWPTIESRLLSRLGYSSEVLPVAKATSNNAASQGTSDEREPSAAVGST